MAVTGHNRAMGAKKPMTKEEFDSLKARYPDKPKGRPKAK